MPQIQIIRDLLDNDVMALVVKDSELGDILAARYKGDLNTLVKGGRAIDTLKPGDKVLIIHLKEI